MSGWPELDIQRDHDTLAILHLAAQMLGKIRVAHAPWLNHGWHVALQPNARGLSTLPTAASGDRTFTLTLDLCRHAIVLWVSDESREEVPLNAGSIAALHHRLVALLDRHFPRASTADPTKLRMLFHSRTIERRASMTATARAGFARRSPPSSQCSRSSGPASRARSARCISGGALRPRGDALFGPPAPPAPRRRPRPARPDHPRGL